MHKIINCIDWQVEESWVMKEIQRGRERMRYKEGEWEREREPDTTWWNESERLLKLSHKNTHSCISNCTYFCLRLQLAGKRNKLSDEWKRKREREREKTSGEALEEEIEKMREDWTGFVLNHFLFQGCTIIKLCRQTVREEKKVGEGGWGRETRGGDGKF